MLKVLKLDFVDVFFLKLQCFLQQFFCFCSENWVINLFVYLIRDYQQDHVHISMFVFLTTHKDTYF